MFKKIAAGLFQSLAGTLALFLMLETGFWAAGFPRGATRFIETISIRENLSARKPKGEARIFTYGESTMHGSHYGPVSNIPRWLEAYLRDFLPGRNIKIVNFARMGQGAHFIYESFRDTVDYKPDLAVFYVGHNAFLPDNRKWEVEAKNEKFKTRLTEWLQNSRFISAVYRGIIAIRVKTKRDAPEDRIEREKIEAPLGAPLGPENAILPTDPRYAENIAFFKDQIAKILDLAEKRKIPVLFFTPVGNLKDFSPCASAHIQKISADELSAWEQAYEKGKQAQAQENLEAALGFYRQAYAIDPTYAELSFRLGQIHFRKGDLAEARRLFVEARDHDTIIVRAPAPVLNVFETFRKTRGLELLDTEKILVSEVPGGILGEPVVEDNVHFSVKGHALLGRALAGKIYQRGWIAPQADWQFDRARSFEEISNALGVTPTLLFLSDIKMVNYFGSRVENRVRFAKKALEIYPENPLALRHLAWTYWWMQKQPEALEVYRTLNRISPEAMQEVLKNQPEIRKVFEG